MPRRVLPATQIFQADEEGNVGPMDRTMASAANSMYSNANDTSNDSIATPLFYTPTEPQSAPAMSHSQIPQIHIRSPSWQRRATVSTRSPELADQICSGEAPPPPPFKPQKRAKSYGHLFQMHIAPIPSLGAELSKISPPGPTHRPSQGLDKDLCSTPRLTPPDVPLDSSSISSEQVRQTSLDDPASSPVEGIYDRFLMASSGVKRLGKGYQSSNTGPLCNNIVTGPGPLNKNRRNFFSRRKPMPPPVSSEDQYQLKVTSMVDLGLVAYSDVSNSKDDGITPVTLVRKAIKMWSKERSGKEEKRKSTKKEEEAETVSRVSESSSFEVGGLSVC